jgi:hypothetical protein
MSSGKQPKRSSGKLPARQRNARGSAGELATMKKQAQGDTGTAPVPAASADLKVRAPLLPSAAGAAVVSIYSKDFGADQVDITAMRNELLADAKDMLAGDMSRAEGMLFTQAHALQSIFTTLARRAEGQDRLGHWESHLRMALKAQNQCRMTLETLATLKNPPVLFAKQANINNGGQQQINNGVPSQAPIAARTQAENGHFEQSKLLEVPDGERMDFGAAGAAAHCHPAMAAVGTIDGAEIGAGKGDGGEKRRQGARARKAPRARQSAAGPA